MNPLLIPFPGEWDEYCIQKEIKWDERYNKKFYSAIPLMYEAAYFYGYETLKPWQMCDAAIPTVLQEWETIKPVLHEKFSIRDVPAVRQPMKIGIGLFLELLYWCNHYPAVWQEDSAGQLKIKPVNVQERLNFVRRYPNKYHSYIQLTELFTEMEKLFRKHQIIQKS